MYDHIKNYVESSQILLINSETSTFIKNISTKDVNNEWVKYRVVIYSPTITMGISFDVKNYFKRIYMSLNDMSAGVT